MGSASYVQSNFLAGEFSPAYQGRSDDEEYKKGLALCLNYIPSQEGSLRCRSGFKRCGNTKNNEPAKLMPFRFTTDAPYVSEFTDSNLRLWSSGIPIFDTVYAAVESVTGDPPVFTLLPSLGGATGIPLSWETGQSILVQSSGAGNVQAAPHLYNREFIINIVDRSLGTVTLTDAVTGNALTGAITFSGGDTTYFYRIIDITTQYQYPEAIRQIETSAQTVSQVVGTNSFSASPPDHKVTYLYPLVSPQSLSYENSVSPYPLSPVSSVNSNLALQAESFIDGPYLDATGTSVPMTVSGTTGTITCIFHQWDTRLKYMKGDLVLDYTQDPTGDPFYYMSLTDNNVGHALPANSLPGSANTNWLQLNIQRTTWETIPTYPIGVATTAAPYNGEQAPDNDGTVYYSIHSSNTNHAPSTSPSYWSTSPPAYSNSVTYAAGSIVTSGGVTYVATSAPSVGTAPPLSPWVVFSADLQSASNTITDLKTGWLSGPLFYVDDAGGTGSALGQNFGTDNPGRVFRLKWSPQPWNSKTTYATDDLVNFDDVIYKALAGSNLGNYPDQDATNWGIQTTTIFWTWGRIVDASVHQFQANIEILGPDLPSDLPVWEFRFGVFSDTTGWPRCGTYHEGRLWSAGPTPNRLDAGSAGQGFNFAPTANDGTVSDANAISLTLNSARLENIEALSSITEGLIIFTSEAEWLVSASALNDPITPTSVQAHRTTAWSAHPNEATRLPSALAAIQKGGRRVMEYRTYADMTSYQSRLNAVDLTRKCQHLTVGGVGQTAYQTLSQPVIWVAGQTKVTMTWQPAYRSVCPIGIRTPTVTSLEERSNLFGLGYMRAPDLSYAAPFSFEHGRSLASGAQQKISSVAVQRAWQPGQENVYIVTNDPNDSLCYVEMMMPLFESAPSETLRDGDGYVTQWSSVAQSFMVDSGLTPAGCKASDDGLSVTFYGMYVMAGETLSFVIMGKYIGDFLVGADGSVDVPFTDNFTAQDIKDAVNGYPQPIADGGSNELSTPAFFQTMWIDLGTPVILFGVGGFFGQFGYKFRRRGKMLRPIVGGANGPTFAKIIQNSRAGIYVDGCYQIKAGGTFNSLVPVKLTVDGQRDTTPLVPGAATTGIYRGIIKDGNTFDGQICWEQTDPVPGNILAVGGFNVVEDV